MSVCRMKRVLFLFSLFALGAFADEAQDAWAARQHRVKAAVNPTGTKVSGRIVGGVEVTAANYPFQLSLREGPYHICGASVIAEQWALTAAHCQSPPSDPSQLSILGGTNQRSDDSTGVVFQVDIVICHPKFNPVTYDKDVCVLHVTTSFLGHPNIAIIPIAESDFAVKVNSFATVSGWGLTAAKEFLAPTLRAVSVPITSMKNCRAAWNPVPIATSALCAGMPGKDSCNGDSGGPLVQAGVLIGLVSWGDEKCGSALPGIYTFVGNPNIRAFIKKNTGV
uniref:Peptidase S1 domain-containing protein n=1 Tax=Anopheles atroparvus TaxID=41427 RepID=A0A182J1U7_ANOAO